MVPQMGLRVLKDKVIVYDCMDDALEFKSSEAERRQTLHKEQELLSRADLVLVSSRNLREKLLRRGAAADKLVLMRNAFGGAVCNGEVASSSADKPKNRFQILYVGAIGEYLEFDVLLHCVNSLEEVEFHFFGPVRIDVPAHERLKFYGVVEHSDLAARVQQFDCFVMPFIVNELIQGVDPVKLYEYINFNKNIICPYYAEIDRFSEFVFFYRNKEEFVAVVKELLRRNKPKYSSQERRLFLEKNSWEVRTAELARLIDGHLQIRSAGAPSS